MKRVKKYLKRIPLLILSFAVLVWGVQDTAYAAVVGAYNASDYVSAQIIDGDTIHATFTFDSVAPFVHHLVNGSTVKTELCVAETDGDRFISSYYITPDGTREYLMRTYLGGVAGWYGSSAPNNGTFYVGDIMPGAEITITGKFNVSVVQAAHNAYPGNNVVATYRSGVFFYDSDGNSVDRFMEDYKSFSLVTQGTVGSLAEVTDGFTASYAWTLPSDVQYILPFIDVQLNWESYDDYPDSADYSNWRIMGYFWPFEISTDINMIYKDSLTMDAIKDELGEVSDKLDEIITGSPEDLVDAEAAGKEMDSVISKGDEVLSDLDAMEKPDPDSISPDASEIMAAGSVSELTSTITPWFENKVFRTYLVSACGLMFTSFVLFGKKV